MCADLVTLSGPTHIVLFTTFRWKNLQLLAIDFHDMAAFNPLDILNRLRAANANNSARSAVSAAPTSAQRYVHRPVCVYMPGGCRCCVRVVLLLTPSFAACGSELGGPHRLLWLQHTHLP